MGGGAGTPVVFRCAGLALVFAVVCVLETPGGAQQGPAAPSNVRIVDVVDTVPPVISLVNAAPVLDTSATITWTTNEPTFSQVEYGATAAYGSATALTTSTSVSHSIVLGGLSPATTYHYRVKSYDLSGNPQTSGDFVLATLNSAVVPIADTSLNLNATNYSTATTLTTYTWPDNRVANAILLKFDLANVPTTAVVQDATLTLSLVDADATADSTYSISAHKIVGKAPIVSAATGFMADGDTAWTPNACCSNNVPMAQADLSAAYDTRAIDKALGPKVWSLTALVQEWIADPASNNGMLLNSDTTRLRDRYRYFASMEHTNTSLRPALQVAYSIVPDTTPPVISAVTATSVSSSGAAINWTTDEPADSQVQYGLTSSYGSQTALVTTPVRSHSVVLTGLTANTLYHYRVLSRDFSGNQKVSGDFTFTTAASDLTPPAISLTAPTAGATVSGTVPVTATASDNVGVSGVQFKLDGANLGAEDTTSPYSVSWNTTAATNGNHTLTAVARDGAGNQSTSAGVAVTVSNGSGSSGIAALYPGDAGIESHPDVIFTEMFEQSSIANMTSRYVDVNHSAGMSFSPSIPAGSGGSRSLSMTTNGGANEAAGLYKTFANDQQWYLRYYINYNSAVEYGHTSVWLGGYNPLLTFPNPQAGNRPSGSDRFSTGVEPLSFDNDRWMPYTYWKDMRVSGDGQYWGNVFLPANTALRMQRNRWYCVETMVKLNSPVTDTNGELAMWVDGQKILHLGKGFPNGVWNGGTFTEAAGGSPFAGFQWRSDPALALNWIWLQNYVTGVPSSVQFDHVVLARNYVGCLAAGSGTPDTVAPTSAMSAPAEGAIVSGSAVTVSATASDNVGVAGVQFKLDGVNLGAEDTSSPYSIVWNTTGAANGLHTLTAVARDAAGNVTTSAGRTVTVTNLVTSGWPNEPAGFVLVSDQPWSLLTGLGWNYLRRTASKNSDIAIDAAAPLSPASVLRMIFTTDMAPDSEPGVHWIGLSPRPSELYMGWWMKVSPNWKCSPAGCGKITFAWAPDGQGQVYSNLGGSVAPHRININTEWAPYGQHFWEPNVTTTPIVYDTWYRIEWYLKYASSTSAADGVMRWWVNGVLNGNYANVRYPGCCFQQFEFAPTLQNPPPAEQYMYIDHTRVSRP